METQTPDQTTLSESFILHAQRVALDTLRRSEEGSAFFQEHYQEVVDRFLKNHPTAYLHVEFRWTTYFSLTIALDNIREMPMVLRELVTGDDLSIIYYPDFENKSAQIRTWSLFPRHLDHEELGGPFLLFNITGVKCERVQTGVVETPVFETRCDWGEG